MNLMKQKGSSLSEIVQWQIYICLDAKHMFFLKTFDTDCTKFSDGSGPMQV